MKYYAQLPELKKEKYKHQHALVTKRLDDLNLLDLSGLIYFPKEYIVRLELIISKIMMSLTKMYLNLLMQKKCFMNHSY